VLFAIPPLMVLIPAMLPLGIQLVPAGIGFAAVVAVVANRSVEIGFGFLDCMLAMRPIIGVRYWDCNKPGKRRHHHGCYRCPSNSLNHCFCFSFLLLGATLGLRFLRFKLGPSRRTQRIL
jgi:hypothetical protein